jgi:hypothetical protein
VPPPPRAGIEFGYFGVDGAQVSETAAHVTFVHTPDWGDWDNAADRERIAQQTIAYLQEAQARGVRNAWLSVGFLVFDNAFHYRGSAELVAFKARIEALGLGPMVVALYPVDEPELHGITSASLTAALADIRVAWPGPKLAVIYGDHGSYPALDAYDWIGKDDYGRGIPVIGVRPDQRVIVVPGGTDPWRDDPESFYAYATANTNVVAIIAFVWFDHFGGTANRGIRSNGLSSAYCDVGMRIKFGPQGRCAIP